MGRMGCGDGWRRHAHGMASCIVFPQASGVWLGLHTHYIPEGAELVGEERESFYYGSCCYGNSITIIFVL